MNLIQDGKVRYLDVIKAIEMGIVTLRTGYDPIEEKLCFTATVKEGYTITDEFIRVMQQNSIDLYTRTRRKEEEERITHELQQ